MATPETKTDWLQIADWYAQLAINNAPYNSTTNQTTDRINRYDESLKELFK